MNLNDPDGMMPGRIRFDPGPGGTEDPSSGWFPGASFFFWTWFANPFVPATPYVGFDPQARQERRQQARKDLRVAVDDIAEALKREECAALFSGHDPVNVLNDMMTGTTERIRFAEWRGSDAYVETHSPGVWNEALKEYTYEDVSIVINSSEAGSGYWIMTSAKNRARILLHELGHVFQFRFGSKSTKFVNEIRPDGTVDMDKQKQNQELEKKCFP